MEQITLLLQQLLDLAVLQEKALTNDDVDIFIDLGDKREAIIRQMQNNNLHENVHIQDKQIIEQIQVIDEKNKQILERIKEDIQNELYELRKNKTATIKYTSAYNGMYSGRNFNV